LCQYITVFCGATSNTKDIIANKKIFTDQINGINYQMCWMKKRKKINYRISSKALEKRGKLNLLKAKPRY